MPGDFRSGEQFGIVGRDGRVFLRASDAARLNRIRAEVLRLGKFEGQPPIHIQDDRAGRLVSLKRTPDIIAKLAGGPTPYTFTEQYWTGTAWADLTGGTTGNAYEFNNTTGLAGKVVQLQYFKDADDWRFQWKRVGTTTPAVDCGFVCIQALGCQSAAIAGSTVTVTLTSYVSAITITNAGTGYSSAPTVAFSGGGGTGAAATAVVSGGMVTAVKITNYGTGYTSAPTVGFSGGGGSSAAATATRTASTTVGTCTTAEYVSSITKTASGSGYSSAPTIAITGGGGSGATATCTLSGGGVSTITLTNPGSGYTSTPTVGFSGGGGTGATATAAVSNGCCVGIGAAGTFGLSVTGPPSSRYDSTTPVTGSITVATCAGLHAGSVALNAASGYTLGCCSGGTTCNTIPLPTTLNFDDGIGVVSCTWTGVRWVGTASRSAAATASDTGGGTCNHISGAGSVTVTFGIACAGAQFGLGILMPACDPGGLPPGCVSGATNATLPYTGTTIVGTDGTTVLATASSCSPLSVTGTQGGFDCSGVIFQIYGTSVTFHAYE